MIGPSNSISDFVAKPGVNQEIEAGKVARAFESMIVSEMLRFGAQPMTEESPLDGGSAGRTARDQLFAQLAAYATQGDGLGLAASLELEMQGLPGGGHAAQLGEPPAVSGHASQLGQPPRAGHASQLGHPLHAGDGPRTDRENGG